MGRNERGHADGRCTCHGEEICALCAIRESVRWGAPADARLICDEAIGAEGRPRTCGECRWHGQADAEVPGFCQCECPGAPAISSSPACPACEHGRRSAS